MTQTPIRLFLPQLLSSAIVAAMTSTVVALLLVEPATPAPNGIHPGPDEIAGVAAADLLTRAEALQLKLDALGTASARRAPDPMAGEELRLLVRDVLAQEGVLVPRMAEQAEGETGIRLAADPHLCIDQILAAGLTGEEAGKLWELANEQDRLHEILAAWQERADAAPGSIGPSFDLARAYYEAAQQRPNHSNGNWWVASDDAYSKVLEMDPNHWEARYQKAVHLAFWPAAYGGQARAIRHLNTLVEQQEASGRIEPQQAGVYRWLGNLLDQQGRSKAARAMWQRGAQRHPGDESLQDKLGR